MRIEHVYVHVPFCARRCSYCDFAVTATQEPPVRAWLDAIGLELDLVLGRVHGAPLRTLYVGGGTPSLLGTGAMAQLAERVARHADWTRPPAEWTAEANPESFSEALAKDWRGAGINRLSFGAQSFHAPALRWMGRLHGPEGPARAIATAREAGFEDISIDLIFGLPERLGRDWAADLDSAIALNVDHVSLYGLTAESATPLGRWVDEGREQLASEGVYEDEYLLAAARLSQAGYEHYEVSNFARSGRESRHNRCYWRGAPYIGLGPGAHSYIPPRRRWNTRSWSEYRTRLEAGGSSMDGDEIVAPVNAELEKIWLGLRTRDGVAIERARHGSLATEWRARGWAEPDAGDGMLRLSARGWLLLDRLAVEYAGPVGKNAAPRVVQMADRAWPGSGLADV